MKFDIKIPLYLFKQLLQDIEVSGCSYLDFTLSMATKEMDSKPVLDHLSQPYGKAGDALRKACRKIVMRLKRKSIEEYCDILCSNNVVLGAVTKQLLLAEHEKETTERNDDEEESKASEEETEEEGEEEEYEEQSDENKDDKMMDSFARSFADIQLNKNTNVLTFDMQNDVSPTPMFHSIPTTTRSMFSPESVGGAATPAKGQGSGILRSPLPFRMDEAPSAASSSVTTTSGFGSLANQRDASEILTKYGIGDGTMFVLQDGTAEHPTITLANTDQSERNLGLFGLDITEAPGITHGKYTRDGFKIRLLTASPGFQYYTMRVPAENEYPEFASRCVIIKGPSSNFFFFQVELYLKAVKRGTSGVHESVVSALKSAVTAIQVDHTNRYWAHHLIIFPVGVKLNNFIFSGDAHHVQRTKVPIGVKADHPLNPFGTSVQGMAVYWLIARDGGRQDAIVEDKETDVGLATLFDSP